MIQQLDRSLTERVVQQLSGAIDLACCNYVSCNGCIQPFQILFPVASSPCRSLPCFQCCMQVPFPTDSGNIILCLILSIDQQQCLVQLDKWQCPPQGPRITYQVHGSEASPMSPTYANIKQLIALYLQAMVSGQLLGRKTLLRGSVSRPEIPYGDRLAQCNVSCTVASQQSLRIFEARHVYLAILQYYQYQYY